VAVLRGVAADHLHLVATFQAPTPSLIVMLVQLAGNCALATIEAIALRWLIGVRPQLAGLRAMLIFIGVAGFAAPWFVSGVVAYLFQLLAWTQDFWLAWQGRSLSNGVSALIATPLVLWGITDGLDAVRTLPWRRIAEFAVLVVALTALCFAPLGDASAGPGGHPALLYAPLPLLLWAAARFGTAGLCVSLLWVALQSLSNARAGRGPFILQSPDENVFGLQLFLIALTIPLLLLSALLQQHQETLSMLRTSETALRSSYQRARTLARRLMTAQETERRRIARDLHDDLTQKLTLLSIEIAQLPRDARAAGELAAGVKGVSDRAREIAADVRSLAYQLHPSRLEILGLVAAVQGVCDDFATQHGLRVDFDHPDVSAAIPLDVALCLYRIVQEALQNVVKHSGAAEASVSLSGKSGVLDLQIADRGAGFALDAGEPAGIGLVSMRERINLVGGTIVIDSAPGAGTRVCAKVPLSEDSGNAARRAAP
jgi:signal transduction histidine kinase